MFLSSVHAGTRRGRLWACASVGIAPQAGCSGVPGCQPSFSSAYTALRFILLMKTACTADRKAPGGALLDSGVAKDELMILVIRANINQKGQEDHLLHHSCSVVLMLSWRWQRLVGLPSDAISNGRRHRASREHEIQLRSTWRLLLLLSLLPA